MIYKIFKNSISTRLFFQSFLLVLYIGVTTSYYNRTMNLFTSGYEVQAKMQEIGENMTLYNETYFGTPEYNESVILDYQNQNYTVLLDAFDVMEQFYHQFKIITYISISNLTFILQYVFIVVGILKTGRRFGF